MYQNGISLSSCEAVNVSIKERGGVVDIVHLVLKVGIPSPSTKDTKYWRFHDPVRKQVVVLLSFVRKIANFAHKIFCAYCVLDDL